MLSIAGYLLIRNWIFSPGEQKESCIASYVTGQRPPPRQVVQGSFTAERVTLLNEAFSLSHACVHVCSWLQIWKHRCFCYTGSSPEHEETKSKPWHFSHFLYLSIKIRFAVSFVNERLNYQSPTVFIHYISEKEEYTKRATLPLNSARGAAGLPVSCVEVAVREVAQPDTVTEQMHKSGGQHLGEKITRHFFCLPL